MGGATDKEIGIHYFRIKTNAVISCVSQREEEVWDHPLD